MLINILLVICGYLLGSIPSAVWIGKRFYGIDVREHGSKNAGATNTLRVLGRRAALPVFVIDFMKGFAAVELSLLSAYAVDSPHIFGLKIALIVAVVVGHIFPIFAGFKGGKGVATVAGAVLAMAPLAILLTMLTFALILVTTHYVSLGSITASIMFPIYLIFIFDAPWPLIIFGFIICALMIFMHRKNIKRLINGTESKTYLIRR